MKVQLYASHHWGEQASNAPSNIGKLGSTAEAVNLMMQPALAW